MWVPGCTPRGRRSFHGAGFWVLEDVLSTLVFVASWVELVLFEYGVRVLTREEPGCALGHTSHLATES